MNAGYESVWSAPDRTDVLSAAGLKRIVLAGPGVNRLTNVPMFTVFNKSLE